MGLGTGVLRVYYLVCFMRGLTVGVASTSSLFIARRTGVPQNWLVAARGIGLTLGPAMLGKGIGRMVWSGESQSGFALCLAAKMLCELLIPRNDAAPALYAAFFVVGLTIALLDTSAYVLVTRVHGKNCGLPLMLYCAAYGVGSVMAPWVVIALGERAWDFLAFMDCALAATMAFNRKIRGKPRNWKAKIRGTGAQAQQTQQPGEEASPFSRQGSWSRQATQEAGGSESGSVAARVPRRVLRAGMAFMYVAEAAETSVSCWSFTYGATELGLPDKMAALLPSAFYFSFTATRLIVVPLSTRLLPSTIAQVGTLITLIMSAFFYNLTGAISAASAAGMAAEESEAYVKLLIVCLGLMGAGTCPLFAMILASMRQHGELSAQDQGWYDTCINLGMTTGMWLPGVVPLPQVELAGAIGIFFILNAHVRDFPWWRQQATISEDSQP